MYYYSYIDVVSIRNEYPLGYSPSIVDNSKFYIIFFLNTKILFIYFLLNKGYLYRRVFPQLQNINSPVTVTRNATTELVTISYIPNNCTCNISASTIRQAVLNVRKQIHYRLK